MDQHPYYGAVLTVAIPVGLYYAVRALVEYQRLCELIVLRKARREYERGEAAWKALGEQVLSTPLDLGPIQ